MSPVFLILITYVISPPFWIAVFTGLFVISSPCTYAIFVLSSCGLFTFTSGIEVFNFSGVQLTLCDSHGSSTTIFSITFS